MKVDIIRLSMTCVWEVAFLKHYAVPKFNLDLYLLFVSHGSCILQVIETNKTDAMI